MTLQALLRRCLSHVAGLKACGHLLVVLLLAVQRRLRFRRRQHCYCAFLVVGGEGVWG